MSQKTLVNKNEAKQLIKRRIAEIFSGERVRTYLECSGIEKINNAVFPTNRWEVYSLITGKRDYDSLIQRLPSEMIREEIILPFYFLDFKNRCKIRRMELPKILDIFPEQIRRYNSFIGEINRSHYPFLERVETVEEWGEEQQLVVKKEDFDSFQNFIKSKKIDLETRLKEVLTIRQYTNEKGEIYNLNRDGDDMIEDWVPTGEVLVKLEPTPFVRGVSNLFVNINYFYERFLVEKIKNTGKDSLKVMRRAFLTREPSELHEEVIKGFASVLKKDARIYSSTEDKRVREGIILKVRDDLKMIENANVNNPYTELLQEIGLQCRKVINLHKADLQRKEGNTKTLKFFREMSNYLESIDKGVMNMGEEINMLRIENAEGFRGVWNRLDSIGRGIEKGFSEVSKGQEKIQEGVSHVGAQVHDLTSSLDSLLGELLKDK